MGISEEKKQPAAQSLTEDELNAVAGGFGGRKRAEPIAEQPGKKIHCSACNRDYDYYDIRFNQCPKGHFVA